MYDIKIYINKVETTFSVDYSAKKQSERIKIFKKLITEQEVIKDLGN